MDYTNVIDSATSHTTLSHMSKRIGYGVLILILSWVNLMGAEIAESAGNRVAELVAAIERDDADAVAGILRQQPGLVRHVEDADGTSLLHLAARRNAVRSVEALVTAGADFYARDVNGQLPLDVPPGQTLNEARQWLRGVNRTRNAFLGAVHHQKVEEARQLLAADPSLARSRDIGDGWTPVMTACHFGNDALLRVLLDAGCPVTGEDFNSGQSALFVAAEKGHAGCVKLLLEAGADARQTWRVNYGSLPMQMNALHVAAWKGHEPVVAALLEAGVDVNERARAYPMFSPLHFAATEGHAGVLRLLLQADADTTARDGRRHITALQMAEAGKHTAAATVLREAEE
jgi:ankyrin repeat protein